jgi:hypothetical protein
MHDRQPTLAQLSYLLGNPSVSLHAIEPRTVAETFLPISTPD